MYLIGLDIGGTKIEAMLIQFGDKSLTSSPLLQFEFQQKEGSVLPGFVVHKKRIATERHHGYKQIIEKMATLCHDVCKEQNINIHDISGIGLSVPGPVHPATEIVTMSNTMVVAGHNLHKDLNALLNLSCPFLSENDANCFALAEAVCGAGLDYYKQTKIPINQQVGIGLILGSGFGGGVIVHGKIMGGRRGGAGELGHVTLYPNGHPCYCGRQGCAEQYLCGPALEAAMNTRLYSQIQNRPSSAEIFELYKAQDPVALSIVKQYKKDLAFYLGNLTALFDPHYFVLGGGLSLQNVVYENLSEQIASHSFMPDEPAPVFKHVIGDSAGAIGAALVVMEKHL